MAHAFAERRRQRRHRARRHASANSLISVSQRSNTWAHIRVPVQTQCLRLYTLFTPHGRRRSGA
eukprot:scaffold107580_cov66-Phaeocystis_antarctica.AAC.1